MKYDLPPIFATMKSTMVRSHNNRVLMLLLLFAPMLVGGVMLLRKHPVAGYMLLAAAVLFETAGIVHVIRRAKTQSIELGYTCPLCGGPLYDGKANRLIARGECPCCKQFIADKLI